MVDLDTCLIVAAGADANGKVVKPKERASRAVIGAGYPLRLSDENPWILE